MITHNDFKNKIYNAADEFIAKNPERLTDEEILEFYNQLDFVVNSIGAKINKDKILYDFFVYEDIIICKEDRFVSYGSYISKKFSVIKFKKVMDLAAGRMCKLSTVLAKYGYKMYAIDPLIRLSNKEARQKKIKIFSKDYFMCDEYAPDGIGTDITNMDLICGVEPCGATEAGIRQSLKYDKPFDFLLCSCSNQMSLGGKMFRNYEDWYEFLLSISSEIKINEIDGKHYITNYENEK